VPTYQYACTECGHAFEQFQSFSDDALTECPECRGRLRKLFNAVGVVFKGSGFYRNDSRATTPSTAGTTTTSTSEGSSGSSSTTGTGTGSGSGSGDSGSSSGSSTPSATATAS
jgi:putative FmdB family regulatory protein